MSARRIAAVVGALVLIGVIIWIDVRTNVWQEVVILSGLAAGLITFLLTALVIDRVLERSNARRWAPVTRLALTEILHGLADEELSEPSRGVIVVRRLIAPTALTPENTDLDELLAESHQLRVAVVAERKSLAATLGTWSSFLASSENSAGIMRRIAEVALQLEAVRDASLELDAAAVGHRNADTQPLASTAGAQPALGLALNRLRDEVESTNIALSAIAVDVESLLMADSERPRRTPAKPGPKAAARASRQSEVCS